MRKALFVLLCLLLPVLAQGDRSQPAGTAGSGMPSPVVFSAYGGRSGTDFSTGATIQEDANVVSHVTWNGSALVDPYNTWTTNGSISQVTTGPFYPTGFANAARAGASFSDVNYYSTAATSLDFSGDFMLCAAVVTGSDVTTEQVIFSDDNATETQGYDLEIVSGSARAFFHGTSPLSANAVSVNGPNIACMGRSGTTAHVSANGGADATGTVTDIVTVNAPKIGRWASAGFPFLGKASVEIYATSTTYSAALAKQIELTYLAQTGTFGEPLTVTRATTAAEMLPDGSATTCATTPCMFWWPNNVVRMSKLGAHVEGAATNLNIHSQAFGNASYANTSVTETNNTAAGVDGTVDADTLQSTAPGGNLLGNTWTATAQKYTASVWAWTSSGTQGFALGIRDTTASSETTCNFTANTTRTRYQCPLGANATNGDALAWKIYPGGVAQVGTIIAWQGQAEAGAFATSDILTVASAVTRNADLAQIPNVSNPMWTTTADYSLSMVATATAASSGGDNTLLFSDGSNFAPLFRVASGTTLNLLSDSVPHTATQSGITITTSTRYSGKLSSLTASACVNGTCGTGVAITTQATEPTLLDLGSDKVAGQEWNGWIANICLARSAQGCQ